MLTNNFLVHLGEDVAVCTDVSEEEKLPIPAQLGDVPEELQTGAPSYPARHQTPSSACSQPNCREESQPGDPNFLNFHKIFTGYTLENPFPPPLESGDKS